jgi:hypothetical protein
VNRGLVKPHLYPRNRRPGDRNQGYRDPKTGIRTQGSEPSPPGEYAFAPLGVGVCDRGADRRKKRSSKLRPLGDRIAAPLESCERFARAAGRRVRRWEAKALAVPGMSAGLCSAG